MQKSGSCGHNHVNTSGMAKSAIPDDPYIPSFSNNCYNLMR